MTWILALLASVALAQNPPYSVMETKTKRDAAAINSDFRALADSIRKSDAARRTLQAEVTANAPSSTNTIITNFNSTVTFTTPTLFSANVIIAAGLTVSTQIVSGDSAGATMLDRGGSGIVWAESADDVAQASGTIGVMMVSSADDTAKMMWTSTTTAPVWWISPPGVLLQSCAPSTICKVGVSGIFRVQTNDGPNAGEGVKLSATRGMVSRTTSTGDSVVTVIQTNPPTALTGSRPLWIKLR